MSQIAWLTSFCDFPCTSTALSEPNGLLAAGGDLAPSRIISAYSKGIFPWYSDGQPILWWSPSPRMVLFPDELHIGRSNRKLLKNHNFTVTVDSDFISVIEHCSEITRADQEGTWITEEMMNAYTALSRKGIAHSIECWENKRLVGGLYGIALGGVFFGESMFSKVSGASKVAFLHLSFNLQNWGFQLIDCQQHTNYLASFGAREINREQFESSLAEAINIPTTSDWATHWQSPISKKASNE